MALEEIVIDAKGQYIIDIDGFVLPITNLFYDGEDLIGDLTLGETAEVEITVAETIFTNETKTYFGE